MGEADRARLSWPGKCERQVPPGEYRLAETFEPSVDGADPGPSDGSDDGWGGALYHDDNRPALARLTAERAGQVRLAYLDPPYLSGVAYAREVLLRGSGRSAGRVAEFDDRLDEPTYLQRLYECLLLIRDLLAPDGSVWLHCDFRQSHHLRSLLDEVFGSDAFRNEVVWAYGSTARGAKAVGRQLPRNHDVLLWYAGPAARYRPLTASVRIPRSEAARAGYRLDESGRPFRTAPRGDYTDASLARLAGEGRIHHTRSGRVRVKYFARREGDVVVEERLLGDVWTDVPDAMHLPADEPTGYPTQKPERLLERVILASTDPGDLVLDPFAGSGTTLAVAQRLGRRWIGVDSARGAIQACRRRMIAQDQFSFRIYEPLGRVEGVSGPSAASLRVEPVGDGDVRRLTIQVDGYHSPDLTARLGAEPDWREAIDSVLVDPDNDGRVFRARLVDAPAGRRRGIVGRYEVPMPPPGTRVAVKLVDVLGEETLVLLPSEWPAQAWPAQDEAPGGPDP